MEFTSLGKFIEMLPIFVPMVNFVEKLEEDGEVALAKAVKDALQFATANGTIMIRFKMEDGVLKGQLRAMAEKHGVTIP